MSSARLVHGVFAAAVSLASRREQGAPIRAYDILEANICLWKWYPACRGRLVTYSVLKACIVVQINHGRGNVVQFTQ
jgi:hypothetical protein